MLYNVLSEALNTKNNDSFITDSGAIVSITIEDIKKDISDFMQLDASSDDKSLKYKSIIDKLDLLEEN